MPTHSSFTPLPITGIDHDGKRRCDPQAKRKLIEACHEPGISLAGLALAHRAAAGKQPMAARIAE
jgi:transposase